jgi:hypothetical protein
MGYGGRNSSLKNSAPGRPAWLCFARAWKHALGLLLALFASGCAHVPKNRYGVDELNLDGVEKLDPGALRACLATRERETVAIELSKSPAPACGKPPFDAKRIHLGLFRWPWTAWPLYEPGVFERDISRVERWYRARGFYDAHVLAADADPPQALYGTPAEPPEVKLTLKVEEGKPVLIRAVSLEGISNLNATVGAELLDDMDKLSPDERFDETTFDLTKAALARTLRDAGFATAQVEGRVDVDPAAHVADIRVILKPGPFSEFGSVCVEGHGSLPAKLILQSSDLRPGKSFSETDLEDARTRIYQMRVFSEVEIIAGHVDPKTGAASFEDTSGQREGEFLAWPGHGADAGKGPTDEAVRVCRLSKSHSKNQKIPIEIRVKPGKLWRFGFGAGLQIGVEDGQRAVSAAQQWDVHLFSYLEVRNFLGGLRRLRIEERPRMVFLAQFPYVESPITGKTEIEPGNNLSTLLEWPAFLEARTLLRITGAWDRGPDPYGGNFIRDDVNIGVGPSRSFFSNRLRTSFEVHLNPYYPQKVFADGDKAVLKSERYDLLFLQQTFEWDQRNDRSSPRSGRYYHLDIDESLPPSNWNFVRLTPEAREYVPLPYGLVLATRFGIGMIHIYKTTAGTEALRRLGPRPYRLRGGGPYSVRGVPSGALGMRPGDQINGFPGGTRSWIASIELRIPLGDSFGVATFIDAGDVDGGSSSRKAAFRFDHPNTTFGAGLRYKTIVGPLRLDVGWLVPGLQGNTDETRVETNWLVPGQKTVKVDRHDPLFKLQGAVQLTIGEAF